MIQILREFKAYNFKISIQIESHKLDFKARARPKTDTGLIYIEDEDDGYMNNTSECVSVENLNDTQGYSS